MDTTNFNDREPSFSELLAARPHVTMTERGLALENVLLSVIADEHGTPLYIYGADTIAARYRNLTGAFNRFGYRPMVAYAAKSNDNLMVLARLAACGAGADIVSEGELRRAMLAGIPADRIVFSGVGKTRDEIATALRARIRQINVESHAELTIIHEVAQALGLTAPVALRINPDVDAGTLANITTGRRDNKFGIPLDQAAVQAQRVHDLPNVELVGLSVHIGSQVTETAPFRAAFRRLGDTAAKLLADGHRLRSLDIGGSLGISYHGGSTLSANQYAAVAQAELADLLVDLDLILEPGRWIVGPAGLLLTRVILEKRSGARRFVVLDAAMNDLMRPAIYGAWHGIVPVDAARYSDPRSPADIVGPICETTDCFAKDRLLPDLLEGDLLAILDAGAYGAVLSSSYNSRPRAGAVMVAAGRSLQACRRQSFDGMIADEMWFRLGGGILPDRDVFDEFIAGETS